jgi:hypothetical protein
MKKIFERTVKVSILTITILLVSSQAYANPPDNMVLGYDISTSILEITITHPTLDQNSHYIYKIDVKVNGDLVLSEQYTSQPTSSTFTYEYTIVANTDDEISVTAFCSLYGSLTKTHIVPNESAPDAPIIKGPTTGKPGEEYDYSFVTTDPNADDVYYYIEWGDGTNSGWIGPFASGEEVIESHSWTSKGSYIISAKAKDTDDNEGLSGTFTVKMPRTRELYSNIIFEYINILFSRFPIIKLLFF